VSGGPLAGPDPDAFAALLCDWCLEVEPDQQVLLVSTTLAEEIVLAVHRAVLERGAWPLLRISPAGAGADFFRFASDAQVDSFPSLELIEIETIDSWLRIDAPGNTHEVAGIDPERISRNQRARGPILNTRIGKRWCGTLWPTPALAQQARMGQRDYAAFVNRTLLLDQPDPVAAWRELSAMQERLVERLNVASEIRIEAEGTDLRLNVAGRTWINSNGKRNMPSGEVFTGPIEDSAEGTITFGLPSMARGSEVTGAELKFEAGEVVSARAQRGEEVLRAALGMDRGARFLGELGIGTNVGVDRPTGSTLLDEKMAGTIHLALGRSYAETGGVNESGLHWDLVCDLRVSGRLTADGETIVEAGALKL
jgi:aminopeptidase